MSSPVILFQKLTWDCSKIRFLLIGPCRPKSILNRLCKWNNFNKKYFPLFFYNLYLDKYISYFNTFSSKVFVVCSCKKNDHSGHSDTTHIFGKWTKINLFLRVTYANNFGLGCFTISNQNFTNSVNSLYQK